MSLRVGGVATHSKWAMANWINGIVLNGGIAEPIGLHKKWGGWLWRTKQIRKWLDKFEDDELVMITDVYDAYVVRPLDIAVKEFNKHKADIVVSVEEYWSPKGLEKLKQYSDFTEENYRKLLEKKFGRTYIQKKKQVAINAGQVMGYVGALKNLYNKTVEFMRNVIDDDQAALYALYLPFLKGKVEEAPFSLDFGCKIFGTISNDYQFSRDFEWNQKLKRWKYKPTKSYPVSLHFAGEQHFEVYRKMGRKIYSNLFNADCKNKGK